MVKDRSYETTGRKKHKFGRGVIIAYNQIREEIDYLDKDRPLYPDHDLIKEIVKSCKILHKVELTLGNLYKWFLNI